MKRTAVIATMIVALAFGAVGFAVAAAENVVVTANVGSAFEMTLEGDSAITLAAAPGDAPVSDGSALRVKSNRLWDFSKGVVYSDALFGTFMSDSTSVATGTGLGRGVTDITTGYTLDLSGDAAYSLTNDAYTATYTYTAVQQ